MGFRKPKFLDCQEELVVSGWSGNSDKVSDWVFITVTWRVEFWERVYLVS